MALQKAITGWIDNGQTTAGTDVNGNPITVPLLDPVRAGNWIYTNASGGQSVVGDSTLTLAQAEAARDSWLAAGGTA